MLLQGLLDEKYVYEMEVTVYWHVEEFEERANPLLHVISNYAESAENMP